MAIIRQLAALGLWLVLLLHAGQAAAHAFLMETSPEDSAVLDAWPKEVRLRFNEPVTPVRMALQNESGAGLTAAAAWRAEGDTIRLPLPEGLPQGVYRVIFRVTSADGHPVAGDIRFGVGRAPAAPLAEADGDAGRGAVWMSAVLRTVHYFAVLAGLGGGLFLLLVGAGEDAVRDRMRRGMALLAPLAAGSGVLLVGMTGAVLDGTGLDSILSARAWSIGAGSSAATACVLVLLGGAATLSGMHLLASRSRAGKALLLAGALSAALSLAVTGHAGTASPRWLSFPLVFLHGLAAAFWVGALWPLAVMLRAQAGFGVLHAVRRFSRVAVAGVLLLGATGAGMSVLQGVTSLGVIAETDYGRLWLGKMQLVALLIGIAAWNRCVATPRLQTGGPEAFRHLRNMVLAEIVLVSGILALTASFSLTPPPRSMPEAVPPVPEAIQETGYSAVASVAGMTAIVEVAPAAPGDNEIRVRLAGVSGGAAGIRAVSEWTGPDAGPSADPIVIMHDGRMTGRVALSSAGRWQVRIRLEGSTGVIGVMPLSIPVTPPPSADADTPG